MPAKLPVRYFKSFDGDVIAIIEVYFRRDYSVSKCAYTNKLKTQNAYKSSRIVISPTSIFKKRRKEQNASVDHLRYRRLRFRIHMLPGRM